MLKALAMAAILTTQTASPPAPPPGPRCLTRAQLGSTGVVGAAITMNVAHNACRRHLRPTAFLLSTSGAAFVASMVAAGRRQLPDVLTGMSVMFQGNGMGSVRDIFAGYMTNMLKDDAGSDWGDLADPAMCRDADEMSEIMARLTPEQIGRFSGAFMALSEGMSRIMARGLGATPVHTLAPGPAPGARPTPLSFYPQAAAQSRPDARRGPLPPAIFPPAPPASRPNFICPEAE